MIQYPLGVAGVTTRVLDAGDGDDLVLLVHGVGARADRWSRVLDPLAARGYRAVAVDLPGHGLAQKGPAFDYSVQGYAAFIEGVLDQLGRAGCRTVLVGTSLGGHICGALTVRRPDLVSALVLVGSTGLRPWGAERRAATRERLADASLESVARKLSLVMFDQANVTDELIREESAINSSPGARESLEAIGAFIAEHLDDQLVLEALADLPDDLPIQLIWGREERSVVLEIGEEAHARLPGSELVVIDRTAHAPFHERPAEFVAALDDFIRRRRDH